MTSQLWADMYVHSKEKEKDGVLHDDNPPGILVVVLISCSNSLVYSTTRSVAVIPASTSTNCVNDRVDRAKVSVLAEAVLCYLKQKRLRASWKAYIRRRPVIEAE